MSEDVTVTVVEQVVDVAVTEQGAVSVSVSAPPEVTVEVTGGPGASGAPGADGASGAAGSDGATWRSGSGAPSNGVGVDGDFYLDDLTGDVYTKAAGSYSITANIEGPAGNDGTNGADGNDGANGADGSVWRDGSGAPSNGLGVNGDYYLNDANGDVYLKATGSYSIVGNIKGATGSTGGSGAAGAPGSVWYSSTAAPDTALGVDGDYCFVTTTGDVYQKSSGTWTLLTNLKGAPGDSAAAQGTYLVSGAGVAWTSGLTFHVSAATYFIDGTLYTSAEQSITLTAADGTFDRIDVLTLNTSGVLSKTDGLAASQPARPTTDPALVVEVTFVYVPALATDAPITQTTIYAEGVGGEWTVTPSAGSIVVNSTTSPHAGTKDINGTSVPSNVFFTGVAPSPFDLNTFNNLVFYLNPKAAWPGNRSLTLRWYNSTTALGVALTLGNGLYGFNSSTVAYQQIVIPVSNFGVPAGQNIDRLRVTVSGTGASIGFFIDDMLLQAGVVSGPTGVINWRGAWSAAVSYKVNDAVSRLGSSYIAVATSFNAAPESTAAWNLLAAKGDTGATGSIGATGAAGPSNIIHTTTGPADLTVGAIVDGEYLKRVGATIVSGAVSPAAAGSDTQVQFNDGGTGFGGDADLTWDKTNNRLKIGTPGLSAYSLAIKSNAEAQAIFFGKNRVNSHDANGLLYIGSNASFQGLIEYEQGGSTTFTIENTYANTGALTRIRLNGTDVLNVTGAGRVGINITPVTPLHVQGPSTATAFGSASIADQGLAICNNSNSVGKPYGIQLGGWSGFAHGGWFGVLTSGSGNTTGDQVWCTRVLAADTALTEQMRLTANGNLGIGGTANAAALLDVASTTKGLLPPRMTGTQRDAIASPPAGLVVFNTTTSALSLYNGSAWVDLTPVTNPLAGDFTSYTRVNQHTAKVNTTGFDVVGFNGSSLSGSVANSDNARGPFQKLTTNATATARAVISGGFGVWVETRWNPTSVFVVEIDSIADVRLFVGWATQDINALASSDPTDHCALFRYDTGVDGSGQWAILTNDNSGGGSISTNVAAIAADTTYTLALVSRAAGTAIDFYINGVLVGTKTSNLPSVSTILGFNIGMTTLANAAKVIRLGRDSLVY